MPGSRGQRPRALALGLLALLFLANIGYVASARSTLVAVVALLLLFVFQRFGWKQAFGMVALATVVAALTWMSSPYLRTRVLNVVQEIHDYRTKSAETSSGYRLEFWTRSIVDCLAGADRRARHRIAARAIPAHRGRQARASRRR